MVDRAAFLRFPGAATQQQQVKDENVNSAPVPSSDSGSPQTGNPSTFIPKSLNFGLPKDIGIWVTMIITGAALIALLMSFKPKNNSDDGMSDLMFDRWLSSAFNDDDYRPSRRRREGREENSWSGYIPPIIINNPGQQPHVITGRPNQQQQSGE